ncbi:hypothetical protein [Leptolyngbya ohadii]|uniref:hypothetical protein n=1 Tax=Leptolyngbya ohadii TaxID=1962290 RepID=UPI000B59DA25|nr:hypothetical protein [Leptolyngbya ohadii]
MDEILRTIFTGTATGETLRTIFTGIATSVAVFSFFNTTRLWRKTNRPIVSAFVETDSAGNVATMYNLLIINSGNRPAVNIRLKLKIEIEKLVTQELNNPNVQAILECFGDGSEIPLLINPGNTSNYFGITSMKPEDNIWKYGVSFPIEIVYWDLEGRRYTSKQRLVIKYSKAFAGMEWKQEEPDKKDAIKLLKQIVDLVK